MMPKMHIEDLEKAVEYCATHEDVPSDVYNNYLGQLHGAREIVRLIKLGYSIEEI